VFSQGADFQISVNPSSRTVSPVGKSASYNVNVVGLNGFNSQVSLTVSGLPSGASGVFSVPEAPPTFISILLVTSTTNMTAGSFTLTITGHGDGITHAAKVLLTINHT